MKNKRIWVLLGVIVLVVSAFWLLKFRAAVGSIQASKLVTTTNVADDGSSSISRNSKICVVFVGEGALIPALQRALEGKINGAGIGKFELAKEREPVFPNPVLVVKVAKSGPLWTPLFAMSQFSVHAGYASNGDSSFMEGVEQTHTSIGSPDPTILTMYAEYDVNDRSLGVISRPGYYQYLADYLAQEIVAALRVFYPG
jgi:hypothetical protein